MSQSLKRREGVVHWLVSVILNLALPMLPLVVEFAISKKVSASNMVLAASMYSITTGVVSKNALVFILSILISLFYTAMFGHLMTVSATDSHSDYNAFWVLIVLFVTNTLLKFWHHVVELRAYTDFSLRSD
ncbi:hypothetical protein D3C77_473200 [compost metagenome]